MSQIPPKLSPDRLTDPAFADRRKLAAVWVILFYIVLTPLIAALSVWVFHLLTTSPGGFLSLERELIFWLAVTYIGGSPVLIPVATAHVLTRRKKPATMCAIVFGVGALGWTILGLILEPLQVLHAVVPGLVVLLFAFPIAKWLDRRVIFGALPAVQEATGPTA